jgi:hypothetical protein
MLFRARHKVDLHVASERFLASKWRWATLPLVFAIFLVLAHW